MTPDQTQPCEPNCRMCSGEYCAKHSSDPCNCDMVDRHGIPSDLQTQPAPEKSVISETTFVAQNRYHYEAKWVDCGISYVDIKNANRVFDEYSKAHNHLQWRVIQRTITEKDMTSKEARALAQPAPEKPSMMSHATHNPMDAKCQWKATQSQILVEQSKA